MDPLLFVNIGTQEVIFLFVFAIAGIAPLIFAIIALFDVFKREFGNKTTDRILLILLIVFAPLIGSMIYYLVLRQNYPLKRQRY
ncbi:PLDc N-terminal domain-containing protein [Sphingobacterium chuzhouense]|uniref:PLDc N-terminal domain-containing protein n=1 Tax=Sphingobacterium chuzhouense TaxID=1742264 RepID=A0ABR7XNA9_9SPHI|nr:PLDc N-terminal domain-containing protein [Sphingobacterium chuzhouense]MBD1420660.1 PLDc N-terminal domain-containing protein [Sphingobacterium chuzhouense]